jgi:putative ABC transport system substrate-binding protein
MRRRDFIAGISAAAWPLVARAQQGGVPVIGYLHSSTPTRFMDRVRWFLQGLGETGYVEGQNVAIEYRWADDQYDRLPALAVDLVRRQVGVIAAPDTLTALAAKAATSRIPIVFQVGGDPVATGLVASLARPGGNVTGATTLNTDAAPKLLELLHELVPAATIIALLLNPTQPSAGPWSQELQSAASTFGLEVFVLHASAERDFTSVFEALSQRRAGALVIGADTFLGGRSEQLAALALRYALPAIYPLRTFPEAGGLMSYGGSIADAHRLVGVYTGRILKGDKPADLPVQQSTKIELVLNMKTAKALGLTIPANLLALADEVIE